MDTLKRKEWLEYNFSEDARLDRFQLELEAEKQSEIMDKWLDLLNQAQSDLAEKKRTLKFIESDLYLDACKNGIVGITPARGKVPPDGTIRAWIETQIGYRKALKEKEDAESTVSSLQNARAVLEHKKSMIKIEAELWICGYFSRPRISGEVRQKADDETRERVKESLKESLVKRKRRNAEEN